jgi:hypothetical protein
MSDLTLTTSNGVTVTIPIAVLSDPKVRVALEQAFHAVDRDQALDAIWTMIDAEFSDLNVQAFEIEWNSEYDDEGGYFWALDSVALYGPNETYIDDDEAQELFRENLYEIDMDRSYLPDGIYKRGSDER